MAKSKPRNKRPIPPDGPKFRPWTDSTPDPWDGVPSDPKKPKRPARPQGVLRPQRPTPPKKKNPNSIVKSPNGVWTILGTK